jgi:hypothetical protein
MIAPRPSLICASLLLGGCVTGAPDVGERTVFHNPYAAPVIDRSGIGPGCDIALGRDATCLGVPLTHSGRDQGVISNDDRHLTRAQRRILQERAELLGDLAKPPPPASPPPPPEPTLPIAAP